MTMRLTVAIEDLLNAEQYERLVALLFDLRDREPQIIELKDRHSDGSGWRIGTCDGCGNKTVVYEWHSAPLGGEVVLALCPACNGGYRAHHIEGNLYRLTKPQPQPAVGICYEDDVDRFERDYDAHLISMAAH